jgi:hypothetical protein
MDPNREERAFALYPLHQCRVPHISLVFREMWDTAALALKPLAGLTALQGCPSIRKKALSRAKIS